MPVDARENRIPSSPAAGTGPGFSRSVDLVRIITLAVGRHFVWLFVLLRLTLRPNPDLKKFVRTRDEKSKEKNRTHSRALDLDCPTSTRQLALGASCRIENLLGVLCTIRNK